jgi:hypothetical protein
MERTAWCDLCFRELLPADETVQLRHGVAHERCTTDPDCQVMLRFRGGLLETDEETTEQEQPESDE